MSNVVQTRALDDVGRQLALAFSTRCIRLLASRHNPWPRARLVPIIELVDSDATLADAFDAAYAFLCREYRCEYVYTNSLITHAHSGSRMNINAITGLRVFMSIADVVTAGDVAAAYEIKTDLDSFARLELQLHSYSSCFEHVYVVTSHAKAQRAVEVAPPHVGVMVMDHASDLDVARPADADLGRISKSSLFRVLRRGELLAILQRQCGYSPDVPSGQLYRRMSDLFMRLPVETAYREFVTELRDRDYSNRLAATEANLPASLRAAAAGLSLSPTAWRRLGSVLMRPAAQFKPGVGACAVAPQTKNLDRGRYALT